MRFAPLVALAAGLSILAVTAHEADAQKRRDERPRVYIKKRSYLNPGTEVKPQSKSYHDYAFPIESRYSRLGLDPQRDGRSPLPREFDVPGF